MIDQIDFEILKLGNPNLRRKSLAVQHIHDTHTQQLIADLKQFVVEQQGAGIAAPQVNIPQQIFILSSRPTTRYPHAPEMPITAVINPQIIWQSDELVKDWEGCLSVPAIRALVPRHHAIKVRYLSPSGEHVEAQYAGFIARVFQHEYDHLQGKVFLDRVEDSQDIVCESEWLRFIDQTSCQ